MSSAGSGGAASWFSFNFVSVSNNQLSGNSKMTVSTSNAPIGPIDIIPRHDSFVQRQQLLTDIFSQAQNATRTVILHGPGGIGKTSLAYEFASRAQFTGFDASRICRIRIRCENRQLMKEDFEQLAVLLGIDPSGKFLHQLADSVNHTLIRQFQGGVLVFDNVAAFDDAFTTLKTDRTGDVIARFFPKTPRNTPSTFVKLITTRAADESWSNLGSLIRITRLGRHESMELFAKIFQRSLPGNSAEYAGLQQFLDDQLGNSPLAICQAASYMNKNSHVSLSAYFQEYEQMMAQVLSQNIPADFTLEGELAPERRAILTTFNIHMKSLDTTSLHVLNHASFMHADSIHLPMLFQVCKSFDASLEQPVTQARVRSSVKETSLVTFQSAGRSNQSTYEWMLLHRVFQSVLLLRMDPATHKDALLRLLQHFAEAYLIDRSCYINFSHVLASIVARKRFFTSLQPSDPVILKGMCSIANEHLKKNEPESALETLSNLLEYAATAPNEQSQNALLVAEVESTAITSMSRLGTNMHRMNIEWMVNLLQRLSSDAREKMLAAINHNLYLLIENSRIRKWRDIESEPDLAFDAEQARLTLSSAIDLIAGVIKQPSKEMITQMRAVIEANQKAMDKETERKEQVLSNIQTTMEQMRRPTARQETIEDELSSELDELTEEQEGHEHLLFRLTAWA